MLTTGSGTAAGFVAAVDDALGAALGFEPFHGTLNLEIDAETTRPAPTASLDEVGNDHCDGVDLTACRVGGVRAAVLRPLVPGYPPTKVEVVAPVRLRSLFRVGPGDSVRLTVDDSSPSTLTADPAALDAFDAVVVGADGAFDAGSLPDTLSCSSVEGGASGERLAEVFARLDATPGNGVYVGATDGDAAAAATAGTSFLHVDQLSAVR
ncbi:MULTISPECIES: CTP-dependent riboflavin kinase [Haloferax]|nr:MULTISPECIES: CTP-dependent riboflavin kinase [Haloferax]